MLINHRAVACAALFIAFAFMTNGAQAYQCKTGFVQAEALANTKFKAQKSAKNIWASTVTNTYSLQWSSWDIAKSKETMEAVVHMHQRLAQVTQGMALTPLTWTVSQDLITPHPLGGCNMGTAAANGVVDHKGEVFGYRNLFVADGAIVPKAIGLNPSRTIGALAERIAAVILSDHR